MIRMTRSTNPITRLFIKHVVRLKNTIVRRTKIVSLKLQYGKQFQAKKFHFRRGFSVFIEEDCWIGSNVTILKGVHIGKHSVVGAGVIVYKDLPAHSLTVCKQNICTQKI